MRNQLITEHILVNDHRIAAGAHGEGEPVIFPHGTPSSSLIWRNVAPCLVEAGMRVHLFDSARLWPVRTTASGRS